MPSASVVTASYEIGAQRGQGIVGVNPEARTTLGVGVIVEQSVKERLSALAGLSYRRQGAKVSWDTIAGRLRTIEEWDYVYASVALGSSLTSGSLRAAVSAGPDVGFLIKATRRVAGSEDSDIDLTDQTNDVDLGGVVRLSLRVVSNAPFSPELAISGRQGFSDLASHSGFRVRTRSLDIALGCRWSRK